MLLSERLVVNGKIIESDKGKLPEGVLCRVRYPICNIGKLNANNRMYEELVWDKVLADELLTSKIKDRALFGHAEHPSVSQSDLQLTSHVIFDMNIDEGKVYQTFDVVDTPTGRIVDTLLRANCKVGVSTRAEGDLEECEGDDGKKFFKVVPESYKYITTDFTADPSTFGTVPIDIKRGAISAIKAEAVNSKSSDNERKFAKTLLESMKCGKDKCEGCGRCDDGDKQKPEDQKKANEAVTNVSITPANKSIVVSGDADTVNINPTDPNATVVVNVSTPDVPPKDAVTGEPELPKATGGEPEPKPDEELEDTLPVESKDMNEINKEWWVVCNYPDGTDKVLKTFKNEQEACDYAGECEEDKEEGQEIEVVEINESKKIDETKAIDAIYKKAGFTPPKGKGIHTMAFHKLAVNVASGYKKKGESEDESLKKGYATAMDQLGKGKAVRKAHRKKNETKMNAWKVLLNGKEIDVVFDEETDPEEVKKSLIQHDNYDPNIEVVAESKVNEDFRQGQRVGVRQDSDLTIKDTGTIQDIDTTKGILVEWDKTGKRAWVQARDIYLLEESVSAKSKVNEELTEDVMFVDQIADGTHGLFKMSGSSKQSYMTFNWKSPEEATEKGKKIAELLSIKFVSEKPADAKIESISVIAKEMVDLRVKEASTRAEKQVLMEVAESLQNKGLEARMATAKIKQLKANESSEVLALRSKVEEKAKGASEYYEKLLQAEKRANELQKELESARKECQRIKDEMDELIKKRNENINQVNDEVINKASLEARKLIIKEYVELSTKNFRKIHDNVRALLEDCKSLSDVDRVLDDYRDIQRRRALHTSSRDVQNIVQESKSKSEPATKVDDKRRQIVNVLCEHLM